MWENSLRGGAGEGFVQLGGHPIFAPRPKKKLYVRARTRLCRPAHGARGVQSAQHPRPAARTRRVAGAKPQEDVRVARRGFRAAPRSDERACVRACRVQQGKLRLTSKAIVEHHTQVLQRGAAGAQQRGSWPQHDQEQAYVVRACALVRPRVRSDAACARTLASSHNESITSDVAFAADEHVDSDMGRGAAYGSACVTAQCGGLTRCAGRSRRWCCCRCRRSRCFSRPTASARRALAPWC
jgi:hypothetical protein